MDGPTEWIGAEIGWRISVAGAPDVVFEGRIETAQDFGDGVIRISGGLAGGGRFVFVANDAGLWSA